MARYFEEYSKCGCISPIVDRKRDLLGYCPFHGNDRSHVHHEAPPRVKPSTPNPKKGPKSCPSTSTPNPT